MTYILTIALKRPLMTANEQRRAHWSDVRKAKADTELLVRNAVRTQLPPATHADFDAFDVEVVWFAPNRIRRDPDSLGPFTKAALDALVRVGWLVDDSSEWVRSVTQRIECARIRPRIEVRLTRVVRIGEE